MDSRNVSGAVLAFVLGLPLAFFLVFTGVFTDVSSLADRLLSLSLTGVAYAAAGAVAGYCGRRPSLALWLAAPAVIILVWYTTHEPQGIVLHMLYGVIPVLMSVAGRGLGATLSMRRQG